MQITLPLTVQNIIDVLERNGFESYVVGGCVRDSLLDIPPHDWDIATSAKPDQIKRCFTSHRTVDTGIAFGTVTLVDQTNNYQITTFRSDGQYSDGRHPDTVCFSCSLQQDLMRRDFTVNALAFHPAKGLIDYFDGQQDLQRHLLRCVGQPEQRFREDGLRILRAMRFSAQYGFTIDPAAQQAMCECSDQICQLSKPRITSECTRMLCGKHIRIPLLSFYDVLVKAIPPLLVFQPSGHAGSSGFDRYWQHTITGIAVSPPNLSLRLALLLCDTGKALMNMDQHAHAHPYADASEKIAHDVLSKFLILDRRTVKQVLTLVRHHSLALIPERRSLIRQLHQLGEQTLGLLIQLQRARLTACASAMTDDVTRLEQTQHLLDQILTTGLCFSHHQLAVSGRDLIALGIPEGKTVGATLDQLLYAVMDGRLDNNRMALLREVQQQQKG